MNENTRRSAHRSFRDAPALSIALALVCTAAVSLLTAVAAVAPSTARADDGLPTQLPSVASLTDAATAAATDVVGATGTPDVTRTPTPFPPSTRPPPRTLRESSPSEPAAATTPGDTATQDPAQTPDVATQTASPGDTTPTAADTAADTPAGPAQPQPSTPSVHTTQAPAVAAAAANINVSVRIDSPGDKWTGLAGQRHRRICDAALDTRRAGEDAFDARAEQRGADPRTCVLSPGREWVSGHVVLDVGLSRKLRFPRYHQEDRDPVHFPRHGHGSGTAETTRRSINLNSWRISSNQYQYRNSDFQPRERRLGDPGQRRRGRHDPAPLYRCTVRRSRPPP